MNRICLKRKQAQRKASLCTLADSAINENIDLEKHDNLSEISNSPISVKAAVPDHSHQQQQQQHASNQRLFQEFKIQYDQLRHAYQSQRVAYDDAVQQKKKMEIQILNHNPQFYEKEIKRLRVELERYQQENQDHKHKYIIAENAKKQLEATVKVRNEQLKKSIQMIEKQKVSNVQLRHQLAEKQKIFQRITTQVEKSSNVLSQNFEQVNAKCQKLESNYKSKVQDFQSLQRSYQQIGKKLIQTEKSLKANKQIFDQTNFKKSQIIEELETKIRNLNRSSRDTIEGLQYKIQEIKSQRKTQNLLIDQQIESKKNFKQQRINQLEIVRLEQTNKQLRLDFQSKCKLIQSLEQKLLGTYSQEEYQQLERKLKQVETKLEETCKVYEQKLIKAHKQIETLKLGQFRNPGNESGVTNNFQQLLKVQLEQNAKIKRELSLKIDEVYNLKSDVEEQKCKLRADQDEIAILNKKIKSQQKNHKIESDVHGQNMKNEIESLKRKLDMTQTKVEQKTKQIKQKENFIMSTIIGRSRQQDVPLIVAEIQRIFEADYVTRLNAALLKIDELQKAHN